MIQERMKNGASGTDIAKKFSLVSVYADEQTLTIDFVFYVIGKSIHNWGAKEQKKKAILSVFEENSPLIAEIIDRLEWFHDLS